ncbi:helix-turn-helix domain-containing protein [Magnetospirillum sp. 15-1]|uniref:helix-turn-helix transcriptional regulator n=1 Tax=Magnetospirillum sp. 15-1 TaxID=1979370 RepID=UPI000BBCE96B|nr:helix-turn-helix domain-containing protein [Magnetospirillum sp. 15-1]
MMKKYLTTKEVATLARMSTRTIERLRALGRGPKFYRVGEKGVRYIENDVQAWIEKNPVEQA